jgi:steroid delta-isomerase-like uncharacterized protein
MSEKQETIVRRLFEEVWNKGKLDVADQLFTNDMVSHDPVDQTRGLPAFKGVVTKYRSAFPDCRLDIEDIFSAADKVVVRWRYTGTHKGQLQGIAPTGRPVNGTGITINLFSGDRIREVYNNWDALGLMQQLGVVTLPGKAIGAGA